LVRGYTLGLSRPLLLIKFCKVNDNSVDNRIGNRKEEMMVHDLFIKVYKIKSPSKMRKD